MSSAGGIDTDHLMASLRGRLFGLESTSKVGRYELGERIGRGGMGAVYLAHDPRLSRDIAIKVISTPLARNNRAAYVERLVAEARMLAKLNHPNVVTVHDVGEADERVFIAMEYVRGVSLRRWLERHADMPTRARIRAGLPLFEQAALGLAAAHAIGVVHRDFKPDNVLVGDDGRVRVVDFGLADEATVDTLEITGEPTSGATTGNDLAQLVGTPAYMAPEQFEGGSADATVDQWAFCVSLYELCYGRRPFTGSAVAMVTAIASGELELVDRPGLGAPLRAVLRRGLTSDPRKRFADMPALIGELQRIAARPRRRLMGGVVLSAATVGATATWLTVGAEVDCSEAATAIDDVWNERRAAEMNDVLLESSRPYAERSAATLTDALDSFSARWTEARVDACEAVHVRGEHSEALLDLRATCLHRALRGVQARVELWSEGGDKVVDRAADLAAALPGIDDCADVDRIVAMTPPPDNRAARDLADRVDAALDQSNALVGVSRFDEARAVLEPLRDEVEQTEHAPTAARWWAAWSHLTQASGDLDTFEGAVREALQAGIVSGDDEIAARTASHLANVLGHQQQYTQARDWANVAIGFAERSGLDGAMAGAQSTLGVALAGLGELDAAEVAFDEAIAAADRSGSEKLAIAMRSDRGMVLVASGRLEEAEAGYRHAAEAATRLRGADHPKVAHERVNLGTVLVQLGRSAEGEAELRAGINSFVRVYGPEYPRLSMYWGNLAELLILEERYEEAVEPAERALAVAERHGAAASPTVVSTRLILAKALARAGDRERAINELETFEAAARELDANSPSALRDHLVTAARAWIELGDAIQAARLVDEGAALLQEHDDLHGRLFVLWAQSELALITDDHATAIERSAEGLALAESSDRLPPELGRARLSHARILLAADRDAEARALLADTIAAMRTDGAYAVDLAHAEALLAESAP